MAPLTSAFGQWSPPIASTAIVSIDECGFRFVLFTLRVYFTSLWGDFDDFATFVLAAFGAGAVRQLRFVAVRALGDPGHTQVVVRATGGGAPFGVSTFRIRHRIFLLLFWRSDLQIPQ